MGWAVVEERSFDTLQPVIDQVPRTCRQFYSDGLSTYPTLLYYNGTHEANDNKSQTYSVEAVNADMRHYLACLNRRSRCFCRKIESLRQAFWLFVYCYNRRRLFKRKHPKHDKRLADFLPQLL